MSIFYCVCDDDCRYETMTKEQILTAIEQAVENGYVSDPDNAVFSKIKEIRANAETRVWVGTEAQFNAITPAPTVGKAVVRVGTNGVLYLCSDDTTFDILNQVEDLQETIENHAENKNNPHGVTAAQVGAAAAGHTHSPSSIGASATGHKHSASDVTSGTFSTERLPVVPITKGGHGATTAKGALTNLGIIYTDTVPEPGNAGRIYLVPV